MQHSMLAILFKYHDSHIIYKPHRIHSSMASGMDTNKLTDDKRIELVMRLYGAFRDHDIENYIKVYITLYHNDIDHLIRVSGRRPDAGLTSSDKSFYHNVYSRINTMNSEMLIPMLYEYKEPARSIQTLLSEDNAVDVFNVALTDRDYAAVKRAYDFIWSLQYHERKPLNSKIIFNNQRHYEDEDVRDELNRVGLEVLGGGGSTWVIRRKTT